MKPLQPLKAFVEANLEGEWIADEEFITYKTPTSRIKVVVESLKPPEGKLWMSFCGIHRTELLAEEGVPADCADAAEFADDMVNHGWMDHLSPHEIQHMITAMKKYLKDWHDERVEAFHRSTVGNVGIPPDPLDYDCDGFTVC